MKRDHNFEKRTLGDEVFLLPVGEAAQHVNGMLALLGTAEYVWDHIEETKSMEDLVNQVASHYGQNPGDIAKEIVDFVVQLVNMGLFRPESQQW